MRVGLIGLGSIGRLVARGVESGLAGEAELVGVLEGRDVHTLLAREPEVVIEAASPGAVLAYAEPVLERGLALVVASGSALVDASFRRRVEEVCARRGGRVYVPSGALAGLDALYAADRVSLRVVEPGDQRVLFSGSAREAIERFPGRLNVAAAALLATGADVQVEFCQGSSRAIQITASGAFGRIDVQVQPTPLMVALSLLATVRRMQQPIVYG